MRHFLALTIGSTDNTLNMAQNTRELWLASYTLSTVTIICIPLITSTNGTLISPIPVSSTQATYGAGVYPDRIYWELISPLDNDSMISIQNTAYDCLVAESNNQVSPEEWRDFLRLIWIQASWNDDELKASSFLTRLNDLLDTAELSANWEHKNQTDILSKLIAKGKFNDARKRPIYQWREKSLTPGDELTKKSFIKYGEVTRYHSIVEITTRPLKRYDENWYIEHIENVISDKLINGEENKIAEDSFISLLKKKHGKKFMAAHKYICIVQSDGDGVGELLKSLKNDDIKIRLFSQCLNKFAISATKRVVEFGGIPVYSGGDDLLFLAPVHNYQKDDENILHLLNELNELFQENFKHTEFADYILSQSFGLSISYYKHPLQEAYKTAEDFLVKRAKKHKENGVSKNSISFKILKHSGQYVEATLGISGAFSKAFMKLMDAYKKEDSRFLSSIMFQLNQQKAVLALVAHDSDGLSCYFRNNFNEKTHFENKDLLKGIENLVSIQFTENPCNDDDNVRDANLKRIFACLKFIHFLRAKDNIEN